MSIGAAIALGALGTAPVALILLWRYLRFRGEIDEKARSAMRARSAFLSLYLMASTSLLAFFSGSLALPVFAQLSISTLVVALFFRVIRLHSQRDRVGKRLE